MLNNYYQIIIKPVYKTEFYINHASHLKCHITVIDVKDCSYSLMVVLSSTIIVITFPKLIFTNQAETVHVFDLYSIILLLGNASFFCLKIFVSLFCSSGL